MDSFKDLNDARILKMYFDNIIFWQGHQNYQEIK